MVTVTPTVQANLENAELAVRRSTAILLQGGMCTGKTMVASYLADKYGKKESMIHINVDDTMDSKDLLGKLSATDVPGVFDWVPGPLTTAVKEGLWVLMEDIDLASFDVFSVLLTLLQDSTLFVAEKNTTIYAHPDFKIIATQRLRRSGDLWVAAKASSVPYAELWTSVILTDLPPDECITIVTSLFPNVPDEILTAVATVVLQWERTLFSLRDLIKWAARVGTTLSKAPQRTFLSTKVKECAFMEGVDSFCARLPPSQERDELTRNLAEACGQPTGVMESLTKEYRPQQSVSGGMFTIGRVKLPLVVGSATTAATRDSRVCFAETKHAMNLLERLAGAVWAGENALLTGETGVGKTFIVQYLADVLGKELVVHNLNQQTDCSDFMGGWKPVDVGIAVRQVYAEFVELFSQTFSVTKNAKFLNLLGKAVQERSWELVLRQVLKGFQSFRAKGDQAGGLAIDPGSDSAIEVAGGGDPLTARWEAVCERAQSLLDTVERTKTAFAFTFEEGSLVKAWREGHWILLDEVNLAMTDVLERVSSVIGGAEKLFITERGGAKPIPRHPDFRVFANMNPPTDVGKKDLPPSLRTKFTEFYVAEPFERNDINIVVSGYIGFLSADPKVDEITSFFLECVANAATKLCSLDGESKAPSFSLRTLTRALSYVRRATALYGFHVALYDGLMLGFATPLQRQFHHVVEELIVKNIFAGNPPPKPRLPRMPISDARGGEAPAAVSRYIAYEHIWLETGDQVPYTDERFILTPSVTGHLRNLARAVFAKRPVLLEGPTSAGKSSMVEYLAAITGHKFVRINNHDSTEIQEYIGHYVSDEFGKLRFVDGILVDAVRYGHWVVLDELNLAPSDVLEALNRLLDDNCELFIADTQELVKPHPQLRIFATQNPAGAYGGRKLLSRAFRNRFLEITVDDIPTEELTVILCQRYALPQSFAEKMVLVMVALQRRRQASQLFAGKHGFITPRDLFRWAERLPETYQALAEHGFILLADRCRRPEERQIVKDVIEDITKTNMDESVIYDPNHWPFTKEYYVMVGMDALLDEFKIVWTESMQRLFTTTGLCLERKEPVLLVGETGSSKTTICQLWSALLQRPLHIINCHQHSEASDFLGGLRPLPPGSNSQALFEWQDGPIIRCMKEGSMFVLDEVSLAEDSVLERLNSVLEPSRTITLAEKSTADVVKASERFLILATMNPGGDFGKKELSPALRNRFTEIYVRPITDVSEVTLIASKRLDASLASYASKMAALLSRVAGGSAESSGVQATATTIPATGAPPTASARPAGAQHISIRDVVAWVSFMNASNGRCDSDVAFLHGLDAVVLDGLSVGAGQSEAGSRALREACIEETSRLCNVPPSQLEIPCWKLFSDMQEPLLPREMEHTFFFGAPSTQRNLSKLMRGMVMTKAILLEGSPGVGKTSIVEALGCALGKQVVRINLSDQTDIMDLFGTYLPLPAAEGAECDAARGTAPTFAWSDGVLLDAVKRGLWVILDELNLAGQSVLEGLNALLDHRSTVYLPELCQEVHTAPGFRIFACQNPLMEGGGRKGLPRSFLNRFTKVRVEAFDEDDMVAIATAVCHDFQHETVVKMVRYVVELQKCTMEQRLFGVRGSPWEFNLRDVLRWAKVMRRYASAEQPGRFADTLFFQRLRTEEDQGAARALYSRVFGISLPPTSTADFLIISQLTGTPGGGDTAQEAVFADGCFITNCAQGTTSYNESERRMGLPLLLLPSRSAIVASILTCAEIKQFALLIGPSGSGKTTCLRAAAALAGVPLATFSVTSSCDTVDLLGGFDQVEGKQGQFEWRDSVLVEAMVHGHWLVLDNANFCSASALDRLNPLVEPNGFLSINEQGLVEGKTRTVYPHPRFRLFATLDPKFGEISRAMRNRAVELFVPPIAIPSLEGLAVATAHTGEDSESAMLMQALDFHNRVVEVGFHANASQPASGALCDALSAGAPNMFTLLKAVGMTCSNNREAAAFKQESVSESPAALSSAGGAVTHSGFSASVDMVTALLHKYITNRSGQWQIHRDTLTEYLHGLFQQGEDATATRSTATEARGELALWLNVRDLPAAYLVQAFRLRGSSSAVLDTARTRAMRSGLPMLVLAASHALASHTGSALKKEGEPGHVAGVVEASHRQPSVADAAIAYFLLEQCRDGVVAEAVTEARRQLLNLPAVTSILSRDTLDRCHKLISAVGASLYFHVTQMDALWCRVSLQLGRQWAWFRHVAHLADQRSCLEYPANLAVAAVLPVTVSESGSLNTSFSKLLTAIAISAGAVTNPALLQDICRFASRLVPLLVSPHFSLNQESYLPLATLMMSARSFLRKQLSALESRTSVSDVEGAATSLVLDCIVDVLDRLQQYLGLPYSFLHPKPRLLKVHPKPLATTAEERRAVELSSMVSVAMRHRGDKGENAELCEPNAEKAEASPPTKSAMHPLWECAAFRREFILTQQLALLTQNPSAQSLVELKEGVEAFYKHFCSDTGYFSSLDLAMWDAVRGLQSERDVVGSLSALLPVLRSQFLVRYPLRVAQQLSPGSWAPSASRALLFASAAPIIVCEARRHGPKGMESQDQMVHATTGSRLAAFFKEALPVQDSLSMWLCVAQKEWWFVTSLCFPGSYAGVQALLREERSGPLAVHVEEEVAAHLRRGASDSAVAAHAACCARVLSLLRGCATSALVGIVLLGILKCRLLEPTSPIDPSLKWRQRQLLSKEDAEAFKDLTAIFHEADLLTAYGATGQSALVERLLDMEKTVLAKAESKSVLRPDPTGVQYARLVHTFHQFSTSLLSDERVQPLLSLLRLMPAVASDTEGSKRHRADDTGETVTSSVASSPASALVETVALENWGELVRQEMAQIVGEYGGYEDVSLLFVESALAASMASQVACHRFTQQRLMAARRSGGAGIAGRDGCMSGDLGGIGCTALVKQLSPDETLRLISFPPPPLRYMTVYVVEKQNVAQCVAYLDSCLTLLRAMPSEAVPIEFAAAVFHSFFALYSYVRALEEEEQKDEAMRVLYKEKAITIEGDDEKRLRRFKDLFPSYEKDFIDDGEPVGSATAVEVESSSLQPDAVLAEAKDKKLVPREDAARVGRKARELLFGPASRLMDRLHATHLSFFRARVQGAAEAVAASGPSDTVQGVSCQVQSFQQRFDALQREVRAWRAADVPELSIGEEHRLVSGFGARVALLNAGLTVPRGAAPELAEKKHEAFNAYLDPEPSELRAFAKPLGALLRAIAKLQDTFPGNYVLQRIDRIGGKLAALPVLETPLMKVMAGSEVLLRECYEWERNASRDTSIMDHINALSSYILRWRRMELSCWPHVLRAKRVEYERKAIENWFRIYDRVCQLVQQADRCDRAAAVVPAVPPMEDGGEITECCEELQEQISQFFKMSSDFISDACYGDFHVRLGLLRGFGYQIAAEKWLPASGVQLSAPPPHRLVPRNASKDMIVNILFHLVNYFAQFSPLVQAALSEASAPIEQDIREFCGIMRWEDSTYYAVRATAEKSHLKMARSIAELDDVLRIPVLPTITAEEQRCEDDPFWGLGSIIHPAGITPSTAVTAGAKQLKQSAKKGLGGTGARGVKEVKGGKRKRAAPGEEPGTVEEVSVSDAVLRDGLNFLVTSAQTIVERVAALQAPKTPQTQKTRALKSLFDTMGSAGVPHTHANQLGNWDLLFATSTSLLGAFFDGAHELQWDSEELPYLKRCWVALESATTEQYRLTRWAQRMRDAQRFHHRDISEAQARRGTGFVESLLAQVFKTGERISELLRMRHQMRCLKAALSEGDASVVAEGSEFLAEVVELCSGVESFVACAGWMGKSNVVTFGEAHLATLADISSHLVALHKSNVSHTALRRARLPVASTTIRATVALLQRVEAGLLQLATDRSLSGLAASAEELCGMVRGALGRADLFCPDAGTVAESAEQDGDQISKRHRTEADAPKLATESLETMRDGSWQRDVKQWVSDVTAVLCVSSCNATGALPALTQADTVASAADGSDPEDGIPREADFVYLKYTERLEALLGGLLAQEDRLVCLLADSARSRRISSTTRQRLMVSLASATRLYDVTLKDVIGGVGAMAGLGVVLARLFCVLMKKGFCKTDGSDDDGDGDGDGDGGDGAAKDGTGMDDGKGEKDVTNELENEDQLMNMKDKEENGDVQEAQKKHDGDEEDEEEEDHAADVTTDFAGNKEEREESDEGDDSDEDGEDSDKEMGDVDPAKANERKKARRDKEDQRNLDEDEENGENADEVPEDSLDDASGDEEMEDGADDEGEGADAQNPREKPVKSKDDEKKGAGEDELELFGDEDMSEGAEDGKDGSGSDRSSDAEDDEEADSGEEDESKDRDEDREGRKEDDNASTNPDEDSNGDRQEDRPLDDENADDGDTDGDAESSSSDNAVDHLDENAQYHGEQDRHDGDEELKAQDDKRRDDDRCAPQQPDAGAEEEEQHGNQQEEDDAGQSWKRQDKRKESSRQDKNEDQMSTSTNPYRAVKEALKRHRREIQQLRLDRNVKMKGHDREETEKSKTKETKEDGAEEPEIDAFEFDEDGEREGMAATDENQKPPPPTEAANDLEAQKEKEKEEQRGGAPEGDNQRGSDEDDDADHSDDDDDEAGQRRRRPTDLIHSDRESSDDDDGNDDDSRRKKKSKRRSRATGKRASSEEREEDDEPAAESPEDAALHLTEKMQRGRRLWQEQEVAVQGLAQQLCEQLRLILAPTVADKLQGDYKTGKRINMKKIIPYIASQFKKDRIWLRRTKPNKRTYQLTIALDDSLSMQSNNAGVMSLQAVTLLCKALQQLEVGEFSVVKFGKETTVLHPLSDPFTTDCGPRIFSEILFDQKSTDMRLLLQTSLDYLDEERQRLRGQIRSTTHELQQIFFIISDGQITEDRTELRRLLARAEANKQMAVLVILDIRATETSAPDAASGNAPSGTVNAPAPTPADLRKMSTAQRMRFLKVEREQRLKRVQSNSILDMQMVEFTNGKVVKRPYMDDFPFPYYLVVRELATLPSVIADALRQWFELTSQHM